MATQVQSAAPHRGPVHIREASFSDYGAIAALHARNGLTAMPFGQWRELWKANPAYQRHGGPIGWVLENDRGDLAGSIGNIPLEYEFRGRTLRAATACGWAVDESYRLYSVMLLKRLLRQPEVDLFVFTTVSDKAEPVYRGLQVLPVPAGHWDRSALWIANHRGFAESWLQRRGPAPARALRIPAAGVLWSWSAIVRYGRPRAGSEYRAEACAGFDGRFEDFWKESRRGVGALRAVRSRDVLQWHFGAKLEQGKTRVVALSKGSRMTAYAVYSRQDNPARGLKRARLVDFQALPECEMALIPALDWILDDCRREGVHVVEAVGCWLDRAGWPRVSAPYHRKLGSWTYFYKAPDRRLAEELARPEAWDPTSFDGDASLS